MSNYSSVGFTNVSLEGEFWKERLDTVLAKTIPSQYTQLVAHNMIEELRVQTPPPPLTIPKNKGGFTTQIFWDSDIGKWIEAASYALAHGRDAEIEARIDEIADLLASAQLDDGYLNCWYIGREIENRWTNLRDNHELYNAGHMLEGAIAYFEATGRRKLLDIMEKYVDHIAKTFGPEEGQTQGYPGHQEIELALIKLYNLTGDKSRLDLATYFINQRGAQPHYFDEEAKARNEKPGDFVQSTYEYNQSHLPVRQQDKVVGHAVRAMYMYAAMADLALELGDAELKKACEVLWNDATQKRMYVTAGFGPSASNEGFTDDFDLPNDTAYAETCATVAMIFWAQRMLHLDLDGKYADILELGLFNGALSGLSHGGEHYFYDNRLESDGSNQRWAWHHCPCCTMNVSRLIASVGGYFYASNQDSIAVHLYGGTRSKIAVANTEVELVEKSNYPWSGEISIALNMDNPTDFTLKLRIPAWAEGATASVNGVNVDVAENIENGYLCITRKWASGDSVALELPLTPRRVYAHPSVRMDVNKVTLQRGPLVYCIEQMDNDLPVPYLQLDRSAEISVEKSNTLNGLVTLSANAHAMSAEGFDHAIYASQRPKLQKASLTAIPYFAWNNREPGAMSVWINETNLSDGAE